MAALISTKYSSLPAVAMTSHLPRLLLLRSGGGLLTRPFCSQATPTSTTRDRGRFFFRPEVQTTLDALTISKDEQVFRVARRGQQVMAPKYVFVTDRELERMRNKAKVRAKQKLQVTSKRLCKCHFTAPNFFCL